jgi:hypothetical protein
VFPDSATLTLSQQDWKEQEGAAHLRLTSRIFFYHLGFFDTEEILFASRVGVVAVYGRYAGEILQALNESFRGAGRQSGS